MANEQNLVPFTSDQDREKAKQNGIKGGIASGKVRREKRLIKDSIEMVLGLEVKNEKMKDQLRKLGIQDEDMTNQLALVVAMVNKGLKGDTQAFNSLRDSIGQGVTNKVSIEQVPIIKDDIK